ncbi:MAG TPA: tripartite tricarboxylate transporter substrate-binding protein [Xanthobacteraceae bacterium]|jgi:tripartite-type tricarboxylate transporter receptor subunit TctC|nr:tripartite tricarboxylate transporter substrate-binding protein [Xanthobacteraceae bacterium]
MRAAGTVAATAPALATALASALSVLIVAAPLPAFGGNDYPTRPVTLIVPYAAGGVADLGMRIIADKLSSRLGQQFIVEDRPSAGGVVAAQAGASAAPDGYTLLMTGNNTAIAAALFNSLPYNALTDFASVSTAAFFDLLIVTRSGSPLKSVQDLVEAARKNPGKLNIGTINPGSTQNLAADLFISSAGINAAIVPFRTSPDMAGAVIRGDVDVAFEFYAAISGLLADKKLVALASAGPQRTAYLPDVPTVIESGFKGFEVQSWNGLSVPAATPASVISTLNSAMKDVMPAPEVQDRAKQLGMAMRWSTPEDMTARLKADIAKWGAVIEQAGIAKRD